MIRLDDTTLFGNDAGEDEDEDILVSYFVDQPAFRPFLDPAEPLRVAVGRKGTGKSALLVRFAHDLRAAADRPIVLHLVPSSLAALKEPPATENAFVLENYWKQVLCGALNMELARDIGFAWKDDQLALVETAEIAGFKGKNLAGALLHRLIGKVNVGGVLDLTPVLRPTPNPEQLLARVQREAAHPRRVWLLVDDIDTSFQNTPAHRSFVASFFAACRALKREIPGLGLRATVRTDVFTSLGAEHLDKMQQYLVPLTWSARRQQTLLARRVLAYLQRRHPHAPEAQWPVDGHEEALIELVFTRRMRWGGAAVPPAHVMRVLGGGRPRWIMQLARQAGVRAVQEEADRIGVRQVNFVMPEFGRQRLHDLYNEHDHQFADLKRLVEGFAGGPPRYATADLLQRIQDHYLAHTPADKIPRVDGTDYRGALQLAKFLYKTGFVNGNAGDAAEHAAFVPYDERPDLLEADTNLDDGMAWEVHPAYRNILKVA